MVAQKPYFLATPKITAPAPLTESIPSWFQCHIGRADRHSSRAKGPIAKHARSCSIFSYFFRIVWEEMIRDAQKCGIWCWQPQHSASCVVNLHVGDDREGAVCVGHRAMHLLRSCLAVAERSKQLWLYPAALDWLPVAWETTSAHHLHLPDHKGGANNTNRSTSAIHDAAIQISGPKHTQQFFNQRIRLNQ